jgi:hypothetical protein
MKVLLMMLTVGLMMGSGCTSVDPDEQALKALAEHFATSVERGDKAAFQAALHLDYADRFGHDRSTITDRVFLIVSEMKNLDVEVVGLQIEELEAEHGYARLFFKVKLHGEGVPRGYAWEEIRRRNIVINARKSEGRWTAIKGNLGIDLMGAIF